MSQTSTPAQAGFVPPAPKVGNGLATAGMVLGIVGLVLAVIPVIGVVGALTGGVGLALSIAGLVLARRRSVGKGKAIAGLVLGVASLLTFAVVSAVTVAAVDSAVKEIDKEIAAQEDKSASSDVSEPSELKDVTLGKPVKDDFLGATVKVTLTNHSSKRSDYIGDIVFESPNGKTQYGSGALLVDNLAAGQTRTTEVVMLDELPKSADKITVRITDFDRIESL